MTRTVVRQEAFQSGIYTGGNMVESWLAIHTGDSASPDGSGVSAFGRHFCLCPPSWWHVFKK